MFPLLQGFIRCAVWYACPCSCLLFRMCNACVEIGLFVLMYLVYSRCRIAIDLPVWPTYELLQVLHFNLYVPLEFIFLMIFCHKVGCL